MRLLNDIVPASWIVMLGYWMLSASSVKKDVGPQHWWTGRISRVVRLALVAALVYLYPAVLKRVLDSSILSRSVMLQAAGAVLCVSGIAFAIWARRHLGSNWSSHPALKEGHELVTSGPYRLVRHPIYTGMLTAAVGSVMNTLQALWLYFTLIMIATFVYRIHVEEAIMMRTFPDSYPAYKANTKALIPFIW